jgi:hypothetical protein
LHKNLNQRKMKKLLLTAFSAFTLASGFAQIEKTCYRGAFAPSPTPMWTDTWTEWDPQNKIYPAPTVTVTGNITSNTTWTTGQTVLLSAQCYVKNNSILTIQPGVVVLGDKSVIGAGLFITKGSQLVANGTVTAPIVFTSNQAVGGRTKGDWGGIILLGKATNNTPGGINNIEGLPISSDTEFGVASGADDNDNSGSLKYIRLEFGGYAYQQDKEINGFTFGAVGKSTVLDYLQVSYNNDDAFEWFGGTVNAKHLVSYRNVDDDFDTDFGYSGIVQYGLAVRDPQLADAPAISTSEFFESDNNATGTSATPLTSAIFSNFTCIGALRGVSTAAVAAGHRNRVRIRRNSALKVYNSIFTDQATRGVFIDGSASETNALNGSLKFKNNILAGYLQRATESGTFGIISSNTFVIANGNDTLKLSSNILTAPYSYLTPDYRPSVGSIALSGASFTDAALSAVSSTMALSAQSGVSISNACIGTTSNIVPAVIVTTTTLSPSYCSLSWSVSPGVTISSTSAVNPSFTISTVGTFSVYLTVVNANGSTTSMNAITTSTCENVGLKNNKNQIGLVTLFPNPTTTDVTILSIDSKNAEALSLSIYDITGKLVISQNQNLVTGENKVILNSKDLTNGIYFVTLHTANGKETVKLIVNK